MRSGSFFQIRSCYDKLSITPLAHDSYIRPYPVYPPYHLSARVLFLQGYDVSKRVIRHHIVS
ncbi:uncharacterized protein METZ01_LOCUS80726 [marine metagenome]|uniref:Uncharacterized protein n=1 Tax=marine metagenome TaxID=408172 RepID=A0A381UI55_9ZZZZ